MFHDLTLQDVRRETEDAVVLVFDASEPAFTWKPGQYLTLRAEVGGQDIRRSYSIASLPDEPLCVGVKRVEGGAFSSFAQALDVGAQIQVMPPEGRFVDPGYERLILIAAGSGITPMVSIAGAALARGAEVTLVYGNRRSDTIMFRETLETLKDRYLNKFTLIHILSREAQDVPLLHGHIDGDKLSRLAQAGAIDLAGADGVFLCGPSQMIDGVQETLLKLGVDQDHIHHERFFVEGAPVPTRPSLPAEGGVANGVELDIILDGVRKQLRVEESDATVLDAAERQGVELPYSCRAGMCCTCRCRVAEGSAEMAVNYSLESWEAEAGFILACQTRPTSEKLVLDFDDV